MSLNAPSWLVALLESVSVWDAVLGLGVVVAAVVFVKKRAWRGIVAFARGIVNSAELLAAVQGLPAYIARADERHERLEEKVDGIFHETHNNDGSSVKDAVDRIERSIDEEVKPALVKLAQADDDLWSALDDTQNPNDGGDDD